MSYNLFNMKLIYGKEDYLINQELKNSTNNTSKTIITFDEGDDFFQILDELKTISMFGDKLIIIKNHALFSDSKLGNKFLEAFHQNNDVELIFVINEAKLSQTNPLIKYCLAHADLKECKEIEQKHLIDFIKNYVKQKNGSIGQQSLIQLGTKLPLNLSIVANEIDKLLLESEMITEKMVERSISQYYKEDYFALSNALIENDVYTILKSYKERVENGDAPLMILGQIASTLSLTLLVNKMKMQGLTSQEIADKLKVHIFRIKKSLDMVHNVSDQKIEQLIKDLSQLDVDIKKGKIDENIGMDYFIFKLVK